MSGHFDVVVFGAELQAAVSAALSRPDLHFLFLSERDVVDGWDLPNVTIRQGSKEDLLRCADGVPRQVVLHPAWMPNLGCSSQSARLSSVMARLAGAQPGLVLPVWPTPPDGRWILKGDAWHRPDAPIEGETDAVEVEDTARCGNVYQERLSTGGSLLVTGRRDGSGQCLLGVIAVHQEAFAREEFLIAGETIADREIEEPTRGLLNILDQRGYFSFNWIRDDQGRPFLTSFRPVPRAVFQLFRSGSLDLLEPARGDLTLSAGRRFVVEYNYASYR